MGHSYKDLIVWQKAKAFAVEVYRASEALPKTETYGLTSQVRRSAVGIVSNIAEGQGRNTRGEFIQFLGLARGCLLESLTQLEIAADLKYLPSSKLSELTSHGEEVLRLVNGLIESLKPASKPTARAAAASADSLETRNWKLET